MMRSRWKWSAEDIKKEILKYQSRSEFMRANISAYQAAHKLGLIDQLPKRKKTVSWKWSVEKIIEDLKKYDGKGDVQTRNRNLYMAARSRGLLKEVFPDDKPRHSTKDHVYIWKVVSECDVYKVGITSGRVGKKRIEDVSRRSKLNFEILILSKVGRVQALVIESFLKMVGEKYTPKTKFNGHTEFRRISPSDVEKCLAVIAEHEIERIF